MEIDSDEQLAPPCCVDEQILAQQPTSGADTAAAAAAAEAACTSRCSSRRGRRSELRVLRRPPVRVPERGVQGRRTMRLHDGGRGRRQRGGRQLVGHPPHPAAAHAAPCAAASGHPCTVTLICADAATSGLDFFFSFLFFLFRRDEWFPESRNCPCCEGSIYRCRRQQDDCVSGQCSCSLSKGQPAPAF